MGESSSVVQNEFMISVNDLLNTPAPKVSFIDKVSHSITNFFQDVLVFFRDTDVWSKLGDESQAKLERIVDNSRIQREVIKDLINRIGNNPTDRAAIDELIHIKLANQVTPLDILNAQLGSPVVLANFVDLGTFSYLAESAMGDEYKVLGYFEEIPEGAQGKKAYRATVKLFRLATSPAEEQMKYSSIYRFTID